MYLPTAALLLAASGVKATAILAQRGELSSRDVSQGWSLQSSSTPSGTTSCGNGAYCPSSLHCNTAANHEVAACCSSSSDCRGDVEASPKCADSSWSLWIGYDGNGFCCASGMVGAYDISSSVAGSCVASGSVGSLRTAVLTSTGSGGAAATSVASSLSSASTASVTSAAAIASSSASSSTKSANSASSSMSSASSSAASTASSASSVASSASASASATAKSSAERVNMGYGLMGAAFLAAAAF